MPLLICRTCPRYDTAASGEFSRELGAALAESATASAVSVRHVQCLGGCPEHGVVAVDGMGKARVRFNGLHPDDAEAILKAAHAHQECASGAPGDWEIPAELEAHVSTVTFKRAPRCRVADA